jgi:phosphatidylinositol alpha-1,6-mannosyltransferase
MSSAVPSQHPCLGLFTDLQTVGGIQRASRHMAAVLTELTSRDGAACLFLSLNDPPGKHQAQVGKFRFEFTGFGRGKLRFLLAALGSVKQRPKMIFVNHPNLAPAAWFVKRWTGARLIVVAWGIDVWTPLPFLRRWALRGADLVLAISRYTAQCVEELQGVSARAIQILPLALDPAFWSDSQKPHSNGDGRPANYPSGRVVLSVARLSAEEGYKGIDTVIRALPLVRERVPDVQFVIAGDGDDRPRLESLARESGVAERVFFLGSLPAASPELLYSYSNCEIFALPSKGEGFGLVFLEAMAFGKPVVGGAHGGTLDVIQDGVTGYLVSHGDVNRLAGVLTKLLTDDQLRNDMGARARERVRTHYLFESFAAELERVLYSPVDEG